MTQISNLKSAQITALDTYQPGGDVQSTGFGAQGYMRTISGSVVPLAGDAALSTYRMVRVPTNAVIKQVLLASQAQGAGAVDIGVYYSDSTIDGTPASLQGLVVPTTGKTFFASQISLASAVAQTDETFQNAANAGSYAENMINKRLWDALGLLTDPGGQFDIVLTVDTTAVTTGTGNVSLTVNFVD
jgi:hypothetical protein